MRVALAVMMVLHGLLHLMGFVKAFGLAALPQLQLPISRPWGVAWLVAGVSMVAAAFLPLRWLWLAALAAALSQLVIVNSWSDARFGTLANLIVLGAAVYAFAAEGPLGLRAEYRQAVRAALAERPPSSGAVKEEDLQSLPGPVQRYLRVAGAVGQPKVSNIKATWRGQIRGAPDAPWMRFDAEQHNVYGALPSRFFLMDATRQGLPVDVFHRFEGGAATFRVRLLSLLQLVDAKGPEMDVAETVTLFNDLCLFAPSALIDAPVTWAPVDERTVRARYTRGAHTISATLFFNEAGELVDFSSDDRSQASADGKSFVKARWTTPVRPYRSYGPWRLASGADVRWESPDGGFVYGEFELTGLETNVAAP